MKKARHRLEYISPMDLDEAWESQLPTKVRLAQVAGATEYIAALHRPVCQLDQRDHEVKFFNHLNSN